MKKQHTEIVNSNPIFNDRSFIANNIVPFLDELDIIMFSSVNKACSIALKVYKKHDKTLSILSNWFFKREMCSECFGKCAEQHSCNFFGAYCHEKCKPVLKQFYIDGLTLEEIHKNSEGQPGRITAFLYESYNPCITQHEATCLGYNRAQKRDLYKVIDLRELNKRLVGVRHLIEGVNKQENIMRLCDVNRRVRIGNTYLNVFKCINHTSKTQVQSLSIPEINAKIDEMDNQLKRLQKKVNKHYREIIKPDLIIHCIKNTNWINYLRITVLVLRQYRKPFMEWLLDNNFHTNPDNLCFLLSTKVDYMNIECMRQKVRQSLTETVRFLVETNNLLMAMPGVTVRKINRHISDIVHRAIVDYSEFDYPNPCRKCIKSLWGQIEMAIKYTITATADVPQHEAIEFSRKTFNEHMSKIRAIS